MSSSRGNVGEHLVMAELLYRGFDAYWADRGNPAFDVACRWKGERELSRSTYLRVKTTSNHSAVWTVKKTGEIFLNLEQENDFVIIVDLGSGLKERDIYIVPTHILEKELQKNHADYVSLPKKDGTPRKQEQGMRCIRFHGEDRPTDCGWGYHLKYANYKEAWDKLK